MNNEEKNKINELDKIGFELDNNNNIHLNKKKWIEAYFWITIGVILLDLAFYFFLDPAKIVFGGVMGLAILLEPVFDGIGSWFTSSIFIYIVNGILLIIGGVLLGKDFFIKTIYGSLVSPTFLFIFEKTMDPYYFYNNISSGNEKLICLICGTILAGCGIGLAIKYNGSTGGMDVLQKIMSKYLHVPMSVTMYLTDMIIVLFSGFKFNPFGFYIENVVYGVIGVLGNAFIVDYIALSLKSRRTVYIITSKPDVIKNLIYSTLDRGVTFVKVTGGYTATDLTMVICTMDKKEAYKTTSLISQIDPKAFTFVTSCKEVRGEYGKRGILH